MHTGGRDEGDAGDPALRGVSSSIYPPLSGIWLAVDPRTDMEGRVLETYWITCSTYADHSKRAMVKVV
jgi:hypothetical protein